MEVHIMTQKELTLMLENLKLRLKVLSYDHDVEVSHCDADHILVEVIELLATAQFGEIPREVSELLSEYSNVPKWYA